MNSINQEQPENNIKDLGGIDAFEKIKELGEKAETCFFCSNIKTGLPFSTRPMAIQKVDDNGDIWFIISNDSNTYQEIAAEPVVQLLFQASAHSGFMNVYGLADFVENKELLDEFWNPFLKAWFTDGKDDKRIQLVKISPTQGHYWDNKHGNMVAFIKQAASAVIGKTFDDSIEGKIIPA